MTSILGDLRHRTALQWHQACYFLWSTILALGGTIFIWGSTSSDLGVRGHGLAMPLRGAGPGKADGVEEASVPSTFLRLHSPPPLLSHHYLNGKADSEEVLPYSCEKSLSSKYYIFITYLALTES